MLKEISNGVEARTKVKAGIDKACNAVRPTLGAVGLTALIEFPGLDPVECDDGVTILKNIELADRYENIGVQLLRKSATRTSVEGGDGTATTTVLTQALIDAAFNEVGSDSYKIREVRDRLDKGLKEAITSLAESSRPVFSDNIQNIANISSLDMDVSKIIAEVIEVVGVDGVVTVEKGPKLGYSHEVVHGARFDSGWISPYFITDATSQTSTLENPWVILADRRISMINQIAPLMNKIAKSSTGKPDVLIIADDVDGLALTLLANASQQDMANIACVKNPYSASRSRDFLFDIAAMTGATVISEERGMRLDDATPALCGRAGKVIVTKDTCTIIHGNNGEDIDERIESIKKSLDASTNDYEKLMLEERLAQLTGGIGVIYVGAYTDMEFNAKKYKFENAVNATQAALQEGIVPGGGIALLNAAYKSGDGMFAKALVAPFLQMAANAGIVITNDPIGWEEHEGIDFKSTQKGNMFDMGIVDPLKVVRLALESAVAVTKTVIGFDTAIVHSDYQYEK